MDKTNYTGKVVVETEGDDGNIGKRKIEGISFTIGDGMNLTNTEIVKLSLEGAIKKLPAKGIHHTLDEFQEPGEPETDEPKCRKINADDVTTIDDQPCPDLLVDETPENQGKLFCNNPDGQEGCPDERKIAFNCPFAPPPALPPASQDESQDQPPADEPEDIPVTCDDMTEAGTCKLAGDCARSLEERQELGCNIPPKEKKRGRKKKEE